MSRFVPTVGWFGSKDTGIDSWQTPDYLKSTPPMWTEIRLGRLPYLNYCRECGWVADIALWFTTGGPYCPRCKSDQIGRLVPEDKEAEVALGEDRS